jgi:hypothetical protein
MNHSKLFVLFFCSAVALLVSGCGGTADASIGGMVFSLTSDTSVGLLNNGSDPITVSADGNFTFDVLVASNSDYNVTVGTQPIGETCTVTNGSGMVDSNGDPVTWVSVTCGVGASVIGTVSGLASGASITLLDNGIDTMTVTTNGPFAFPADLAAGTSYHVTASANPVQSCTVANGTGVMPSNGSVPNVTVTC